MGLIANIAELVGGDRAEPPIGGSEAVNVISEGEGAATVSTEGSADEG